MRRPLLLSLLVLLLVPTPAAADGSDPWARVNRCQSGPDGATLGIRAGMPGSGADGRMYMHFEAQWFSRTRKAFVPTGSSSPWVRVGSSRWRSAQSGYTFRFAAPPQGSEFVLRGRVSYQWRARRNGRTRVVRRATRITRGKVTGVRGSVPAGRSDGLCVAKSSR